MRWHNFTSLLRRIMKIYTTESKLTSNTIPWYKTSNSTKFCDFGSTKVFLADLLWVTPNLLVFSVKMLLGSNAKVCVCVFVCVLCYFYIRQLTLSLLAVTQYHLVTVSLTAWSGVRCLTTVVPCGVVSLSSTVSPTHDKPLVTIEIQWHKFYSTFRYTNICIYIL